jgi:ABC-type Na+ efflux pump permease subunit
MDVNNAFAMALFFLGLFLLTGLTFGVFHGIRMSLRSRKGERQAVHVSLPITIFLLFGIIGFFFLSPTHPDSKVGLYVSLLIGILVPSVLCWLIYIWYIWKRGKNAGSK